jgi:hypothetical protein
MADLDGHYLAANTVFQNMVRYAEAFTSPIAGRGGAYNVRAVFSATRAMSTWIQWERDK